MVYPRISARRNEPVDLNVDFYHAGVLTDPFALFKVEIFRAQVLPCNKVATIPIMPPTDINYPLPVQWETTNVPAGQCGTAGSVQNVAGKYHLIWTVPPDCETPNVYFDVWSYFPVDPLIYGTNPTEMALDLPDVEGQLLQSCNRFWVYPNEWLSGDGLTTIRFGFEPLDQKFNHPEVRPLEVGLMPLPLYDYDFNLVTAIIPFLTPTITIETAHPEVLVENAPMTIGLRQGSYRANPWVIKYNLDTTKYLRGTYKYKVLLNLPDGTSRASKHFFFTVW